MSGQWATNGDMADALAGSRVVPRVDQRNAARPDFPEIIAGWRDYGLRRIPENLAYFSELLNRTATLLHRRRFEEAAVWASIAAFHANARHCGLMTSPALEGLLSRIAAEALPGARSDRPASCSAGIGHVCHVITQAQSVGGLTRMLARWIRSDAGRRHSIAITRQATLAMPSMLVEAVAASGGSIHHVDAVAGGLIARARRLRSAAAAADLVVLHIHASDVVPSIAFAGGGHPPVAFLDHADHAFWVGNAAADLMISMRPAGQRLMVRRRGIPAGRVALLPTILETRAREMSRREAKRRLGLDSDCILLCSVARARKYATVGGTTYADLHVPTLLRHPRAVLLVVGAGARQDWSAAVARSGGRIIALPEQDDPSLFFHAADIYVDSFPFVSITSALEAGCLGTPVVSIFPYGDEAQVLGANMPGLDRALRVCRSRDEYERALALLIGDAGCRRDVGEALQRDILDHHTGGGWLRSLERVYERARGASGPVYPAGPCGDPHLGEPDLFIEAIHGGNPDAAADTARLLKNELGVLPSAARTREWVRLLRSGDMRDCGRFGATVFLLPEWSRTRIGRFRRGSCRRRPAAPRPA